MIFKNIIYVLTLLLIGFCSGYTASTIYMNGCSFFEFKFKDITITLVPIFIAFCVTYYLNKSNNNVVKSKEVLITLINKIETLIIEINEKGERYIDTPNLKDRKEILNLLKSSSNYLNILFQAHNHNKCFPDYKKILFNDYLNYKKSLTDDPFMNKMPKYSKEQLNNFENCGRTLITNIFKIKLTIYLDS